MWPKAALGPAPRASAHTWLFPVLAPFPSPASALGLGPLLLSRPYSTNSLIIPPCLKVPRKLHALATPSTHPRRSPSVLIHLPTDHQGNSHAGQRSGLDGVSCRNVTAGRKPS